MITYTCAFCQTVFTTKWKSKTSKQYCTKTCANKDRPPRQLKGICKHCSKSIYSGKLYCDEQCKAKSKPVVSVEERKEIDTKIKEVITFRQKMKLKGIEYKGEKCQCCGYSKYQGALEYHHLDPSKKDFNVSRVTRSWDNIKAELDKCILVCSNCHREIHGGIRDITPPVGSAPTSSKLTV
jgi:hypothetical protein